MFTVLLFFSPFPLLTGNLSSSLYSKVKKQQHLSISVSSFNLPASKTFHCSNLIYNHDPLRVSN